MSHTLPAGRHYAVTWGIPDSYAGMTNALLHRSRAFVRLAGTPVTVVTYAFRDDYDAVRRRLTERSHLIDGMTLINLWEDLRGWDDDRLRRLVQGCTEPDSASFTAPVRPAEPALRVEQKGRSAAGKATVQRADYYRPDGTLLVSDRRDVDDGGHPRSVTVCDTAGRPLGTWRSVWGLYWAWLDSLPRDPVAWFIVDSKTSANHVVRYQRPDVVTLHLVHGSHLADGHDPLGPLNPARAQSIERHASWDALVLLTQSQLDDLDARYGPGTNRYVNPDGRDSSATEPSMERDPRRGIVVARLTPAKRVSHAIRAAARAGRAGPWGWFRRHPLRLDVVGDGVSRTALEALARRHRRNVDVRFHGHVSDVPERLGSASFLLHASRSEGLSLAIVEAMAAGCIPVSYDVRYGPSDIITDGVDGFLVPDGAIRAMGAVLRRLTAMDAADLAAMRRAAVARAHDFDDDVITRRWGTSCARHGRRRRRPGMTDERRSARTCAVL